MVFAGSSGDIDGGECFKECELLVLSYLFTLRSMSRVRVQTKPVDLFRSDP